MCEGLFLKPSRVYRMQRGVIVFIIVITTVEVEIRKHHPVRSYLVLPIF